MLRAEWDVREYIEKGNLIHVLQGYDTPDADIYAVYPQQHRSTTRVKAFVDFLTASFRKSVGPKLVELRPAILAARPTSMAR